MREWLLKKKNAEQIHVFTSVVRRRKRGRLHYQELSNMLAIAMKQKRKMGIGQSDLEELREAKPSFHNIPVVLSGHNGGNLELNLSGFKI